MHKSLAKIHEEQGRVEAPVYHSSDSDLDLEIQFSEPM